MSNERVTIKLRPYNALTVLSFLREYINDDVKGEPKFVAIMEAVDEFEGELIKNMSNAQISDAIAENQVNQLIGKSPER